MSISSVSNVNQVSLKCSGPSSFHSYEMLFEDGTRVSIRSKQDEQSELERIKQELKSTGLLKKFQFCAQGVKPYAVCDLDTSVSLPGVFYSLFEVVPAKVLGRNDWFTLRVKPEEASCFQDRTQLGRQDASLRYGERKYPDGTVERGTFGTSFSGVRMSPSGSWAYVGMSPITNPRVCWDTELSQVVLVETTELHNEHYKPIGLFVQCGQRLFGKELSVGVCVDKTQLPKAYEVRDEINPYEVVFRLLQCPDLNGTLMNMHSLTLLNKLTCFESFMKYLVSPQEKWGELIPIFHIQESHFKNLENVYQKRGPSCCFAGPFGFPRQLALRFNDRLMDVVRYGLKEENRPYLHQVLTWMFQMDERLVSCAFPRTAPSAISECLLSSQSQVNVETGEVICRDDFAFKTAEFLMQTLNYQPSRVDEWVVRIYQGQPLDAKRQFKCLHPDFLQKLKVLSLISGHRDVHRVIGEMQAGLVSDDASRVEFDWNVSMFSFYFKMSISQADHWIDFGGETRFDFSYLHPDFVQKLYDDALVNETTRYQQGIVSSTDFRYFQQLKDYVAQR